MQGQASSGKRQRDVRIDVFRGVAMFIIFIAHVPANPWNDWIPARFGPSDAAEWFVFCSGFASAVAFGGVFRRRGFGLGVMRVAHRCWQIYWAHLGMFFATAATVVAGSWLLPKDYVGQLNLQHFFDNAMNGLVGLLTLTYVPNYFDILPMYFAILVMLPILMALSRLHLWAALAFPPLLWAANRAIGFDLPAEWWSDRPWFFNPFGWQLIFFTGFAFSMGWLRPPPPDRRLIALAAAVLIVLIPLSWKPIWDNYHWANVASYAILWGYEKTDFGIIRFIHFLAIAYLLRCAFLGREHTLHSAPFAVLRKVGQQALAVFVTSMVLARVAGMLLDQLGRDPGSVALVNLAGFVLLAATAYFVAWVKQEPWRKPPPQPAPAPETEPRAAPAGQAAE